jgi:segregation and condensation protein B
MQQREIAGDRMSLKAKLEAVIYAAEEPVTLAQLAGLFTDEALQWKAEQDAAAAAAAGEAMAPSGTYPTTAPLLSETFAYLEQEQGAEEMAEDEAGAGVEGPSAGDPTSQQAKSGLSGDPDQETGAASDAIAAAEVDDAAATKQQVKQREREARAVIKKILGELIEEYAADARGIEIREIAGGYRMATKPEFHEVVRSFVKSLKPPLKLSLPALETLAVIAYKQPVTAPEVNEIRGVDSSAVFGSLLARKLIATAGRKPVVGRPILYKTTREFLLRFGLKDVSELPSMEEFEKMAASELEADETSAEAAANGQAEEFNPDPSVEMDEAEAIAPEAALQKEAESNPSGADGGAAPASGTE